MAKANQIRNTLTLAFGLLFLTGCASWSSYPEDSYQTGPYQASGGLYGDVYDDVAPDLGVSIADAAFYPWMSVDYFYLGRHHYRPGYWGTPRHAFAPSYGVRPHYWPYYGFYSPMYYPYATYAWYDPWYGWPRYGIGTNYFWREINWATRNRNPVPPAQQNPGSSDPGTGVSGASAFIDAFYDPRDRAPVSGVAPVSRSATSWPKSRPITRPPSTAITGTPRVIQQIRPVQARPGPSSRSISAPRPGPSRATSAPRPGASTSAGPTYKSGRRKNN